MDFGDPWTSAQQALVNEVIAAWGRTGRWPTYQYVATVLDDQEINAAEVLQSFPVLGQRGSTQRAYADVNFDHIHPNPPENSSVSLSVSGLSRHPLGEQSAQTFAAVLRYAAERWAQAPRDPLEVIQVKVTSEETAAALAPWPSIFIRSAITIIQREPVQGITSSGEDPEANFWYITVGLGISRYRNLTVERYLAMVQEEYGRAERTVLVRQGVPPFDGGERALPGSGQGAGGGSVTSVPSIKPERAIRELTALKEEAHTADVQAATPAHDKWKAKVRTVMEQALGRDASVLRDFQEVRYHVGVWVGAPGEVEEDRRYFAQQVKSAVAYIDAAIYELQLNIDPEESVRQTQPAATTSGSTAVFLVHGHNQGAKYEIARFLQRIIGREPVILDEQPNAGQTLVEKFEQHAGASSYAVVLLTPDDVGRAATEPPEADTHRARQNVVFELGYFFGRLGRGNVSVINAGVEKPSDVDGLVYISYPNSNWKLQLAKELQAAGIAVDLKRLLD